MTPLEESSDDTPVPVADFRTTHWSVVLAARGCESASAEAALTKLCQTYWYPLYAFVRRQGNDVHRAQDLTQDFFARILEKGFLQSVSPHKGKFRSFLLASVKNFLVNDWNHNQAAKRGGGCSIISWDDQSGESRYLRELFHEATPEKIFEQSWALTVIDIVLGQLRKDYAEAGKSPLFEAVQNHLTGDDETETYAAVAARLNMTEGAVKMSVLRLRRHFGSLLRAQIAQTVNDPSEVEEEMRHLFAALGG